MCGAEQGRDSYSGDRLVSMASRHTDYLADLSGDGWFLSFPYCIVPAVAGRVGKEISSVF
jgi:hypothetical protein